MAQVFSDATPPKSSQAVPLDTSTVIRQRYIHVDTNELPAPAADTSARAKQAFNMQLFDDLGVVVTPVALEEGFEAGQQIWKGQSEGFFAGSVTLVSKDGITIGTIRTADLKVYEVRYAGDGVHVIREVDQALLPDEADPVAEPLPDDMTAQSRDAQAVLAKTALGRNVSLATVDKGDTDTSNDTFVDVMILYTPAALTAIGGTTAMGNLIATGFSEANTAFTNSKVDIQFRLVYSGQVNYSESGSTIAMSLSHLRETDDGQMDWIHTTRTNTGADIVSLWSTHTDACGIGSTMTRAWITSGSDFSSRAFNVVAYNCVSGYSFAHESGHNMGCQHDEANVSTTLPAYEYSYGYQQKEASTPYRTIMAYPCTDVTCNRVGYWSSPDNTYLDKPMGNATADNVQSLNNLKATVADWKDTKIPALGGLGALVLAGLLGGTAVWRRKRGTH